MDLFTVDLYKPDFWCVLAVAVLVLVPITSPTARKWAWAAINLSFLGLLLGVPDPQYLWRLVEHHEVGEAAATLAAPSIAVMRLWPAPQQAGGAVGRVVVGWAAAVVMAATMRVRARVRGSGVWVGVGIFMGLPLIGDSMCRQGEVNP